MARCAPRAIAPVVLLLALVACAPPTQAAVDHHLGLWDSYQGAELHIHQPRLEAVEGESITLRVLVFDRQENGMDQGFVLERYGLDTGPPAPGEATREPRITAPQPP